MESRKNLSPLTEYIEKSIIKIQPYYDELNSNYSKSYLSGSAWYVGNNLMEWWKNCNNVRYFTENKQKLLFIIYILLEYKKNKLQNPSLL
jgi:hypothetical protein